MTRKYDVKLVDLLKERQITSTYKNAEVTIKRLPDCDEDGSMDPRLYADSEKMMKMMKWIPSFMMKMDMSEKNLGNLRETFNGVKSVPTATADIHISVHQVPVEEGVTCSMYEYTDDQTTADSPVLYYIHGGGFFGGHHGVVEESLKLMCEKYHFHIFSYEYRLAPETPYPKGHEDCFKGLEWIYDNRETLGISREGIFVAGDSAGGNLTQYCSTRDHETGKHMVAGQMLLYPTLNMCNVEDEFFKWDISYYNFIPSQKKALSKQLKAFGQMTSGMQDILKVDNCLNDYLNPYTMKDYDWNPPTFISVGEHDYLKVESLSWGAKLKAAGVDVKMVVYNGMGHAYFDNCGVYPQCEDVIDEMASFMISHS